MIAKVVTIKRVREKAPPLLGRAFFCMCDVSNRDLSVH